MFLGAVKAISIGDARKLASQIYIDVRAGKDPARDKIESQSAAAETFATIVAQYLRAAQQRLRPRSSTEVARHLLKNARPLHPLSAGRLTRRDIAALLVKVAQERGHITSNRYRQPSAVSIHGRSRTGSCNKTRRSAAKTAQRERPG